MTTAAGDSTEVAASSADDVVEQLRVRAEAGDPEAQSDLGNRYLRGLGVSKDPVQAVLWLEKAAPTVLNAKVRLAYCYERGVGVEKRPAAAVEWYRAAAELGSMYAQHALGECYCDGRGVKRDPAESSRWLRLAAEQGHVKAQVHLGRHLRTGSGVAKNDAEAAVWYRRAAEFDNAEAQRRLGFCCEFGHGVAINLIEACRLYLRAAERGDITAQRLLAGKYAQGKGVSRNPDEAVRWYSRAIDDDSLEARAELGRLLLDGRLIPKDAARGLELLRYAASHGNLSAKSTLAGALLFDRDLEKNDPEAIALLKEGVEEEDAYSEYLLGHCHLYGRGVVRDFEVAGQLLRRAESHGLARARPLVRALPLEKNPILRQRHKVMNILGWLFLIAHTATAPFQFHLAGVGIFIGILVATTAVALPLIVLALGKERVKSTYDAEPDSHPVPFWKLLVWVPPEDGLFMVPLLYVGITPLTVAVSATLFAASHYPKYPWSSCAPKGVAYFAVAYWVLPLGVWTVIAGHLAVDALVQLASRLGRSRGGT